MIIQTNRVLRFPDANETGGSPSGSADVKEIAKESSTEAQKGTADQKDVKEPETLEEVAQAAFKKATKEQEQDSSTKDGEAEESRILSSNSTEKEAEDEKTSEATDGKEDGKEKDGEQEQDKGPVPYERFQETIREKQEFETKVKEYEPLVNAHKSIVDYCQTNSITEEQFQQGMEMLKLINTDPVQAKKVLEPIWNQLNGLTGDILPTDLAKEVEDGVISKARAHEIAKLRAQATVQQARGKLSEQELVQQKQAATQREIGNSLGEWTKTKQTSDPEFKPKASANAVDGKFEFVADRFYKLMAMNPVKSAADALKLVEQAYQEINKSFGAMKPKANLSTKNISSTKSSNNSKTEPKTVKDAVDKVLAKYKV